MDISLLYVCYLFKSPPKIHYNQSQRANDNIEKCDSIDQLLKYCIHRLVQQKASKLTFLAN